MIESFQRWLRPYALALREIALVSDQQGHPAQSYVEDPFFRPLHFFKTPPDFWEGYKLDDGSRIYGSSSLESAVFAEELAYGDAGLFLAVPGPNLAGAVVQKLGTTEQKAMFFGHFLKQVGWSAFALTEPEAGSDAANITTIAERQEDGSYVINGSKRYIGNGSVADYMVLFAKTQKKGDVLDGKALFIESFLIQTNLPGIIREHETTLGLRAARLGKISLQNVVVRPEHVLGHNKRHLHRGFRAALSAFYHMRPATAGIAIGICRAAIEHVEQTVRLSASDEMALARLKWEIHRARQLTHEAARQCDNLEYNAKYPSMAKLVMNQLAIKVMQTCTNLAGPLGLYEHPLLEKWVRDAHMIEFMEGSSNILKKEIATQLLMYGLQ